MDHVLTLRAASSTYALIERMRNTTAYRRKYPVSSPAVCSFAQRTRMERTWMMHLMYFQHLRRLRLIRQISQATAWGRIGGPQSGITATTSHLVTYGRQQDSIPTMLRQIYCI